MSNKKKYYVYCTDNDECEDDARAFVCDCYSPVLTYPIAEYAADHLWRNCDGWEWMGDGVDEMVILDENKKEVGRFQVYVDYSPEFSAVKK